MANSSRDNILAALKSALAHLPESAPEKPDFQSPVYARPANTDPALVFAETFIARKGIFYYCQTMGEFHREIREFMAARQFRLPFVWERELAEELKTAGVTFQTSDRNFSEADCGITLCECLIERTGSILLTSRQLAGRRLSIFPPVHVVVASTGQMLPDIRQGLDFIRKKYRSGLPSMISLVTGASRTADIEKTLVLGAHGPRELVLFLIDDAAP
jgi:L-lactate dehydrogenase complex protein LldG